MELHCRVEKWWWSYNVARQIMMAWWWTKAAVRLARPTIKSDARQACNSHLLRVVFIHEVIEAAVHLEERKQRNCMMHLEERREDENSFLFFAFKM